MILQKLVPIPLETIRNWRVNLTLSLLMLKDRTGPFRDLVPLKLIQDRQHPEDHFPSGSGRVDPLRETNKVCSCLVQLVCHHESVSGAPGEPRKGVDDQESLLGTRGL